MAEENDGKVRMKKDLGILEAVAILVGAIIGSGIFVSPKGVIKEVESIGVSLFIWALGGLFALVGAICYAELGTSIPKSGGDYVYIYEAYGSLASFLYLWATNLIVIPSMNAIMGLTFSKYVIQPLFKSDCPIPIMAIRMVATLIIFLLTFLNATYIKLVTKLQNIFLFAKILAMSVIIISGLVWLCMGHYQNLTNVFQNSSSSPGKYATGFYSSVFSYTGWNYLNFMIEELQNPYVNLPRAIYISVPIVTTIYVLANTAYLAVLTPQQMIASDAIAVTFANHLFGNMAWVVPVMVVMSACGGLSVQIMATSRILYVGARNGHFPTFLSHLQIKFLSPITALTFLCTLSVCMLFVGDIFVLITYAMIVQSFFIMTSVTGLLYLRWKRPDMPRPIKVKIIFPIFFVVGNAILLVLPCWTAPLQVAMAAVITASGVPAYFLGIYWKEKPKCYNKIMIGFTRASQKLFMAAPEN